MKKYTDKRVCQMCSKRSKNKRGPKYSIIDGVMYSKGKEYVYSTTTNISGKICHKCWKHLKTICTTYTMEEWKSLDEEEEADNQPENQPPQVDEQMDVTEENENFTRDDSGQTSTVQINNEESNEVIWPPVDSNNQITQSYSDTNEFQQQQKELEKLQKKVTLLESVIEKKEVEKQQQKSKYENEIHDKQLDILELAEDKEELSEAVNDLKKKYEEIKRSRKKWEKQPIESGQSESIQQQQQQQHHHQQEQQQSNENIPRWYLKPKSCGRINAVIVIDTNILVGELLPRILSLHKTNIIKLFQKFGLMAIVSFQTTRELDGLKKRTDEVGKRSREIGYILTNWSLDSKNLIIQSHRDKKEKELMEQFYATPDGKILNTLFYFKRIWHQHQRPIYLLTEDRNFAMIAASYQVKVLSNLKHFIDSLIKTGKVE